MEGVVMERFNDFYHGRRVLVTGSTGFKGSWLSLWLTMLGARVTGYALAPNRWQTLFGKLGFSKSIRQIDGDITDYPSVCSAVADSKPEVVFHMAAQSLVLESYKNPRYTFSTNVQGTVNLLEALRCAGSVQAIVVITSDKCYAGQGELTRFREGDPLGGKDPYSASKACTELVVASYRDSFFEHSNVGIATVRAGNVIGGGDWSPNRIVPDCINQLRKSEPITLRHPQAIRPWQHVLDPLRGYLMLGARLAETAQRFSAAWNFGPGDEACKPVRDLAQKICHVWGSGSIVEPPNRDAPHEEAFLALDTTKSRTVLHWQPYLEIDSSVFETVVWYRDVEQGADPLEKTTEQIERLTRRTEE